MSDMDHLTAALLEAQAFLTAHPDSEAAGLVSRLQVSFSHAEIELRQQIALDIERRVPAKHPSPAYRDGLRYAAEIALGQV